MNFTNRQLSILSNLFCNPDGIPSASLSSLIGISGRTLSSEIKVINSILPANEQITSHPRKGYRTDQISEGTKEKILKIQERTYSRKMPMERSNVILAVLAFERDYTNMQNLADMLYVSKTAVFKEFESSNILQRHVSVSRQKGLIIPYTESVKRNLLTNCFDKDTAYLYDTQLGERYEQLSNMLRSILPALFQKYGLVVSGESMRAFRRHLAISMLRIERHYPIEPLMPAESPSELLMELTAQVTDTTGVSFSDDDLTDFQRRLNGLDRLDEPDSEPYPEVYGNLEACLDKWLNELQKEYGIRAEFDGEDRKRFLHYIVQLACRVEKNHIGANFSKREIHRKYPLSAHLIVESFGNVFGISVPETEVTKLALFLAAQIDKRVDLPNCVIVSDCGPALLYHLQKQLESHCGYTINQVKFIPDYCSQDVANFSNDVILTTVSEGIHIQNDVILIKPFLTSDNYHKIIQLLEEKSREIHMRSIQRRLAGYGLIQPCVCRKKYKDLDEFCRMNKEIHPQSDYEFVLDVGAIIFPSIHHTKGENSIRYYALEHTLYYRFTSIRTIIFSDYYTASMKMQDFYDCIRALITPDALRHPELIFTMESSD